MPATLKKPNAVRGVRINVSLSEKNHEELKELARQLGIDMSELIRNAVRVYNFLQREKLDGKRLYSGRNNKPEVEIVLP